MTESQKRITEIQEKQKMEFKNVYEAIQANLVSKFLYDQNLHCINQYKKENANLKTRLQNAKNDLEKLQSEYGNRKLSDTLKINNLEAEIKTLRAENSELQNVEDELKKLKSEIDLKIDVFEAGMKTLEAEKRTAEVKFDEVSLKLKLKTHEYDNQQSRISKMLKSKQTDCQVKLVFKSNETEKASIGTQTIKEEPKEIGVVNVPASISSQPKHQPVKTGTKRTSRIEDNRKIAKAKRMKTEKSNSISRATKQSIENQHKIS